MSEGHIFIEGVITDKTYDEVKRQIALNSSKEALVVHIASPGGSVYDGYKIYHAIVGFGKKIKAIIEGEAQSMATFISLAADEIEIKDPSVYMIHNPSQGLQGDADALKNGSDELRMIEDEMAQAYAKKTGKSVDEIKQMMKKETRLSAVQAKQFGFVDKVSSKLKAVAIGTATMEEKDKGFFEKAFEQIQATLNKLVPPASTEPSSVDLATADGKMIVVEGEDGDLTGRIATMDGAPVPPGEHPLADGRILVVAEGGVISEVRMPDAAPPAEENAQQALEKKVAELEQQLLKAQKEKENISTAQQEEVQKTAVALAELKTKFTEITKQPAGDQSKPDKGMTALRKPIGFKNSGPNAVALDLTKAFIKENMQWLHRHYDEDFFKNTPSMVSILETSFNYTYPGILTTDIFYKPTLQAPALSDVFMIDQDIKFKKVYNLVTQLDKIVRPYTGCGADPNTNRQLITNTEVVTKEFQVYEGWCKDDFTSQLTGVYNNLAQEWLKTGEEQFDPAGTPIDTVIMKVLKDAMQRDIWRRVSFAAGNSSDADYNQFDGLWDRNIDSSGASNYCVQRAGTSIAGTLSAGNALTYLGQAYAAAKPILKNNPSARFLVTRSIWDNYYDSLIGNGSVTEQAFKNLQDGLSSGEPKPLYYKGYPVIPVDLWDTFLLETDNPLYSGGSQRNLIMFSIRDNHILGVENGSDLNTIDSWFEKKDQKRYYRSSFKLGYNYLHCDLTTVMY